MRAEDITRRVSCYDALEMLGADLPRRLPGHIPCFGHEDRTPSLYIEEDHYYAFCCGEYGDVIDLVQFATGRSFRDAVRFLGGGAEDLSPTITRQRIEKQPIDLGPRWAQEVDGEWCQGGVKYLMDTKGWTGLFSPDDLRNWGLAATSRDLLVPFRDPGGMLVGVKTRGLGPGRIKSRAAWSGSTFTTQLYSVTWSRGAVRAALCEGESDVWALTKAYENTAHTAVYGLPAGAMTWRDHWATELADYRSLLLFMDQDDAGKAATERLTERFPIARVVELPENDVVASMLEGWEPPGKDT